MWPCLVRVRLCGCQLPVVVVFVIATVVVVPVLFGLVVVGFVAVFVDVVVVVVVFVVAAVVVVVVVGVVAWVRVTLMSQGLLRSCNVVGGFGWRLRQLRLPMPLW